MGRLIITMSHLIDMEVVNIAKQLWATKCNEIGEKRLPMKEVSNETNQY